MKNLVIALALTLASSASFANGFSPWENRAVNADAQVANNYEVAIDNAGFAPWRDQLATDTFANEHGIAMDIVEQNIFRPWS
ncbi:MAG: hypothetical protein AAF387_15570 [Pseudomonadota bacterium]